MRFLMIEGAGRSGSTLLAEMLGSVNGFCAVGELVQIWDAGLLQDHSCGCGQRFSECPYWTEIVERLDATDLRRNNRLAAIVNDRDRLLSTSPRRVRQLDPDALGSHPFVRAHRSLLDAMAAIGPDQVFVDSSKKPVYTSLMRRLLPSAPSSIHIVRHPAAVAFSLQRRKVRVDMAPGETMPTYPAWRAGLAWTRRNLATEQAIRKASHARLRYEDLVEDPVASVDPILAALGFDVTVQAITGPDRALRLGTSHSIAGNPRKFEPLERKLLLDDEWQRSMRSRDRAVVAMTSAPLARRYGYRRGVIGRGSVVAGTPRETT